MELPPRKHLVALALVCVVLLTIVQWWDYSRTGEILENYPGASFPAQYTANVSPILPSRYVHSLGNSIVGYSYRPSTDEYILYIRERHGKPDDGYTEELQWLNDSYVHYLNLTSESIRLWSETGNESYFARAVFWMGETLRAGEGLENVQRGENVTMIVIRPSYPYRLLRGETLVLLGEMVIIPLLIAGTLLLMFRFDALRRFVSRPKYLALLLIVIITTSLLAYGHFHKRPDTLIGVKSHWNDTLNLCGGDVYYAHRDTAADSILLNASRSAEYVDVRRENGHLRLMALALPRGRETELLRSLSKATTVLYMYTVPPAVPSQTAVEKVRGDLLKRGAINETAVDEVINATLKSIRESEGLKVCDNLTVVTLTFDKNG
ncbi:hypothetical protein [Thermococcus henrietii]|uniref:hypothetical protein n=1 Tax=Thermococcus henrietii TaxID=2016361 RepID=UPI000C06EBA4|nr:hypothetical protein [Thermococcus henrietii]